MIRYIFSAIFIIGILTLISVDSKAQNSITIYRIAKIKVDAYGIATDQYGNKYQPYRN